MEQKTYVIGDVHGCYYTLLELLEKLDNDARIIFVGDFCDRGLYSKNVIELIIQQNYECILGNHEDFMIKHFDDYLNQKENRWYDNLQIGGKQTIDSYNSDNQLIQQHIKYLKKLPRYIQIDKYFITHGLGLPYFKRRDIKDKDIQDGIMKARLSDETSKWGANWEKEWRSYDVINIFAHTPYKEVKIGKNFYGIDTGCVYGKKLTALELGSMKIIDVELNKKDIG